MMPALRAWVQRCMHLPVWLVWLGVTCAGVVYTAQPVARVIDSTDTQAVQVLSSTGVETADSTDRLFRWGAPVAALVVPVLPAGPAILRAELTAPQTPRNVTIGIAAQPVARLAVQPEVFRTYQVLVRIPATPYARQSTLTLASDTVFDDGARTLAVGYGRIFVDPLGASADAFLSLATLLVALGCVSWWGLTTALGSVRRVQLTVAATVLAGVVLLSRLEGDRVGWGLVFALVPLAALLLYRLSRAFPAAVQPVAPRAVVHAYRADIDGIRAIAVGAVVLFHAVPEWVPGGFVGVDMFFVLSGFLISQLLIERMQQGTYTLLDFYARRVRRIVPALLVVSGVVLVAAVLLLGREQMQQVALHVAGGAGFVANLQAAAEAGYFDDTAVRKPLLHLWSLGIEEQFYLVWPFVMLAVVRWRRAGWWLIAGLILVSFGSNLWTVGDPAGIAFYWPLMRVWQFAAGAAVATALAFPLQGSVATVSASPRVQTAVSAAALSGIVISILAYTKATPYPGWAALLPTGATALLLALPAHGWLQRHLLARRGMVWLGLVSYPLYLWHWPLLAFGYLLRDAQFSITQRLAAVAVSLVLALLTYLLVEQPIRFGRLRPLHPLLLTAALAAVGGVAWWGIGSGQVQSAGARSERADVPFVVNGSDCGAAAFAAFPSRYCSFHLGTDPSAAPVYIVGDSHALYLARGFFSRHDPMTTTLRGVYGCVPLLGIETYTNSAHLSPDCARGVAALFASLDRTDTTQPRTIVYAARFAALNEAKLNPTDGHRIHIQPPGPRIPQSAAQRLALFHAGVEATMARLAAYPNTRVIVLDQLPELDFNPTICALAVNRTFPCQSARATIDAYAAGYRAVLDAVLARYPQIERVDPTALVCDAAWCRPRQGDVLLYRDDNHLSVSGARRVIALLGIVR